MRIDHKLLVIFGPTASGKSALAMNLAANIEGAEIVSCDSVQVYQGFDIGSAKPSIDERKRIKHHLIDVFSPTEECDAGTYAQHARKACQEIWSRRGIPIIVVGTGLYFRSFMGNDFNADLPHSQELRKKLEAYSPERIRRLLYRLDPKRYAEIHPNDRYRSKRALELRILTKRPFHQNIATQADNFSFVSRKYCFNVYIKPSRQELHRRIADRCQTMLNNGFYNEVDGLLKLGVPRSHRAMTSIGYKQMLEYLEDGNHQNIGTLPSRDTMLRDQIIFATRQYAKRQITWFNKLSYDFLVNHVDIEAATVEICARLNA